MKYDVNYQTRSFVIEYKLNVNISTIEYMKEWLRSATEIWKNKVKYKDKPIRKYLISKTKL